MTRVLNKDIKTPHQINTHIIKSMKQSALYTISLNRKQKVLPPFYPLAQKKDLSYRLESLI